MAAQDARFFCQQWPAYCVLQKPPPDGGVHRRQHVVQQVDVGILYTVQGLGDRIRNDARQGGIPNAFCTTFLEFVAPCSYSAIQYITRFGKKLAPFYATQTDCF
jgi:hypothetical protein